MQFNVNLTLQVELMKETVDRCFASESAKGGLVIKKALFGKLHGENVK